MRWTKLRGQMLHLSEEVDLEAGRPVAFGLTVVQVVSHGENKLWAGGKSLYRHTDHQTLHFRLL